MDIQEECQNCEYAEESKYKYQVRCSCPESESFECLVSKRRKICTKFKFRKREKDKEVIL